MSRLQKYLNQSKEKGSAAIAYLAALDHIETVSPAIVQSIIQELKDERSHLKMIASENFSSLAVQLAMGNLLTDKYAEGYPFHRFYAGCHNVDVIEDAAQQELKQIFGCDYAYVQPHSGADANLVAFWAILVHQIQNPQIEKLSKKNLNDLTPEEYEKVRQLLVNQKVMGMSLNSGGHLTHGYRYNISSKMMKSVPYDVDPKTEQLDYSALEQQVLKEKPLILLAGYSAHPRRINFAKMRQIADKAGVILMVDMAHFAGLVAGKVFQGDFDPVPHAHVVTSTTHKTLRGPRGGFVLSKQEFAETINKGCPMVLGGPLPHVLAAKAVGFKEVNTDNFKKYAHKIVENAQFLADCFLKKGARLVTGGTENHLMILDVSKYGLTGLQAEGLMRDAKITVNRNSIPNDVQGPWFTSGIRLGTPALTTLGMGKEEMRAIADIIIDVLTHSKPDIAEKTGQPGKTSATTESKVKQKAQQQVQEILNRFPLYPEIEI